MRGLDKRRGEGGMAHVLVNHITYIIMKAYNCFADCNVTRWPKCIKYFF